MRRQQQHSSNLQPEITMYQDDSDSDDEENMIISHNPAAMVASHHQSPVHNNMDQIPVNDVLAQEREMYMRLCKFFSVMTCIFLLIMVSVYFEQMGAVLPIVLVMVAVLVVLLIVATSVLSNHNQSKMALHDILTEAERDGNYDPNDADEDQDESGLGRMSLYDFDDTPSYVRSCHDKIPYNPNNPKTPQNGLYRIVYNAVYFGKSIRSESKLYFKFQPTQKRNGWEVGGKCLSGGTTSGSMITTARLIADGFVNANGEMYWRLDNSPMETKVNTDSEVQVKTSDGMCRGLFDLQNNQMFDGEFRAMSATAPPGRIVLMELLSENYNDTSVPTIIGHPAPASSASAPSQRTPVLDDLDDFDPLDEDDGWGSNDVEMVNM